MNVEKSCTSFDRLMTRVDDYGEEIMAEIDQYIHQGRQRETKEEDPSLNRIYIVSKELETITGEQECSGKEVSFNILI